MHCIILLLESSFFAIFVFAILTDQLQAILSDETPIEHLQNRGSYRPHRPKLVLLSEVCGRVHPLLWIFPCTSAPRKFDTPLLDHQV